ncbi:MAG: hypothetical protein KGL39_09820 [Patescibacteria group bacterium]|nr:hypothetical protein [Patescibacteria group bacterium]
MDWAQLAPTIFSFLGGPAGGLIGAGVEFLADKLGVTNRTKEGIQAALNSADPLKVKELEYDFQKFCLQNGIQIQLAQIGVNLEEAKSSNVFVSGWRPAIGWMCGFALGYSAIIEPFARFTAVVVFGFQGDFPSIDTTITMQALFGILGLGAYRSYDKKNGTAS